MFAKSRMAAAKDRGRPNESNRAVQHTEHRQAGRTSHIDTDTDTDSDSGLRVSGSSTAKITVQ